MSDARLRELERAWRASGAEDDEVAWLGERRRHGLLDPRALKGAAALGHAPARRVLGKRAPSRARRPHPIEIIVAFRRAPVDRAGDLVAVGVALGERVAPWAAPEDAPALRAALDAARRCLDGDPTLTAAALLSVVEPITPPSPKRPEARELRWRVVAIVYAAGVLALNLLQARGGDVSAVDLLCEGATEMWARAVRICGALDARDAACAALVRRFLG